jgi:HK97 family phage major capsid protein
MSESAPGLADGALMLLENDGYRATGHVAHMAMMGRFRGLRDINGNPLYKEGLAGSGPNVLAGAPILFPDDGSIAAATSLMFSGAWNQLVYAIRQDITYTVATEAIIQDNAGNIVYNLFQQDMVALRVVIRLGFALPNPINRMNPTAATRYPFSVLTA